MLKKFALVSLFFILAPAFGKTPLLKAINPNSKGLDFIAPVVPSESALGSTPVGLIFYDLTDDALKVIDSSGNALDLTLPQNVVAVGSGGSERIERARINCDGSSSIISQSGSWVSGVGNISASSCAVTINSSTFSAVPTCTFSVEPTCTAGSGSMCYASHSADATTSSLSPRCLTETGADCTAFDVNIICIGPR